MGTNIPRSWISHLGEMMAADPSDAPVRFPTVGDFFPGKNPPSRFPDKENCPPREPASPVPEWGIPVLVNTGNRTRGIKMTRTTAWRTPLRGVLREDHFPQIGNRPHIPGNTKMTSPSRSGQDGRTWMKRLPRRSRGPTEPKRIPQACTGPARGPAQVKRVQQRSRGLPPPEPSVWTRPWETRRTAHARPLPRGNA